MKRCPECRRDYFDDSLLYCLDDGSALLEGPASAGNEPPTAILYQAEALNDASSCQHVDNEAATREQVSLPDRIHPTAAEPAYNSAYFGKKRLVTFSIILILLTAAGYFGYGYLKSQEIGRINSIAVLPFENRSGSTDADYLSDGLTDSLIFRFSQLPNVKVSPTSSVMRYKGKGTEVAEIAKELSVDAVLSGRLMQLGENLTISVELVDARTRNLVWKEQYERKMADLLATQREIATTLTQKMQLELAGDEKGLTKKYTNSNEAYQLYMKGRYHWSRRSKEDLDKAIESYKQAIALDPNFALAYAATAEAYNSMGKNPDVPPKDCIPLAKAAAQRALDIDPSLAQAHSAFADSLSIYDWNWSEAERHFTQAIDLDPNISYLHLVYGSSYLAAVGKAGEARRETERAVELEPLSLIANSILVTGYLNDRQFEKALDQGHKAFELDTTFPLSRHWLGMALIANGKHAEAISLAKQVAPDSTFAWLMTVVEAHAHAKLGNRGEAERLIASLRELAKTRYVRTYYLASIYASLGDKDKAFSELERSFEERDCYLARAAVDPFIDPLRDDPRFGDLLKRMNLSK